MGWALAGHPRALAGQTLVGSGAIVGWALLGPLGPHGPGPNGTPGPLMRHSTTTLDNSPLLISLCIVHVYTYTYIYIYIYMCGEEINYRMGSFVKWVLGWKLPKFSHVLVLDRIATQTKDCT